MKKLILLAMLAFAGSSCKKCWTCRFVTDDGTKIVPDLRTFEKCDMTQMQISKYERSFDSVDTRTGIIVHYSVDCAH